MTKEIDTSNPKDLSPIDRQYLQDRGLLPRGAEEVDQEEMLEMQRKATVEAQGIEVDEVPFDPENTPYDEWPKAELVAEAKRRELPHTGTVKALADRLTESDQED